MSIQFSNFQLNGDPSLWYSITVIPPASTGDTDSQSCSPKTGGGDLLWPLPLTFACPDRRSIDNFTFEVHHGEDETCNIKGETNQREIT